MGNKAPDEPGVGGEELTLAFCFSWFFPEEAAWMGEGAIGVISSIFLDVALDLPATPKYNSYGRKRFFTLI